MITDWMTVGNEPKNTVAQYRRIGNRVSIVVSYLDSFDNINDAKDALEKAEAHVMPETIFPQGLKCESVDTQLRTKKMEFDTVLNKYLVVVQWTRNSSAIERWGVNMIKTYGLPNGVEMKDCRPLTATEKKLWEDAQYLTQELDRLKAENARLREALELIATPVRSDGTYNRSREACEQLAREALKGAE